VPAATSITSKLVILFDAFLGLFASAEPTSAPSVCTINGIDVSLVECGVSLVDALVDFTFALTQFASSFLPAVGTA
jgi:hypothetical protein